MPRSKRKPNKEYWLPGPGDLPSPAAQAAEPLLRDLEHNAVFRLLLLRERVGRAIPGGGGPIWNIFTFALIFGSMMSGSRYAFLAFLAFPIIALFLPKPVGKPVLHLLNGGDLLNLSLAPLREEDLAAAIWGTAARRRRHENACLSLRVLIGAGWLFLMVPFWTTARALTVAAIFALCVSLGLQRAYPVHLLSALRSSLVNQRRALQSRVRLGDTIKECIALVPLYILIGVGILVVIGVPVGFLVFGLLSFLEEHPWFYTATPGLLLLAAFGSLLGTAIGRGAARIIQARAGKEKQKLHEEIGRMLKLWWETGPFEKGKG